MKRVSMEMSDFDLKYIRKVLHRDFLYCKSALSEKLYEDDEEKTFLLFCKLHSKSLIDKISDFLEEQKNE